MDFEKISSRSNEKVKLFRHLSQSASFRRETGLFALEGARLCSDVAKTGIEIKTAFFTKEALEKYPDYISAVAEKAEQAFEIPHELAGTLSDTREAQGVFCICVKRKEAELETIDPKGTYIALDNMQDPSNLGAVLRTAEAFGMSGVIVGGGCDIYNPKALRAAMGSSMRISVLTTGNLPSLLIFAAKKGMLTLASTPSDGAKKITDMSFFWLRYLRCRQRGQRNIARGHVRLHSARDYPDARARRVVECRGGSRSAHVGADKITHGGFNGQEGLLALAPGSSRRRSRNR